MDDILKEFALCLKENLDACSLKVQNLVKKLQEFITENFYNCTNEILYGLSKMYMADERFKNNINKHSLGLTAYICEAIFIYCNV